MDFRRPDVKRPPPRARAAPGQPNGSAPGLTRSPARSLTLGLTLCRTPGQSTGPALCRTPGQSASPAPALRCGASPGFPARGFLPIMMRMIVVPRPVRRVSRGHIVHDADRLAARLRRFVP